MADFAPSADSSASPASRVSHSQEEPPFSLRERHAAGTPLAAPHHNDYFDVDERVIPLSIRIFAALALTAGDWNKQ